MPESQQLDPEAAKALRTLLGAGPLSAAQLKELTGIESAVLGWLEGRGYAEPSSDEAHGREAWRITSAGERAIGADAL